MIPLNSGIFLLYPIQNSSVARGFLYPGCAYNRSATEGEDQLISEMGTSLLPVAVIGVPVNLFPGLTNVEELIHRKV